MRSPATIVRQVVVLVALIGPLIVTSGANAQQADATTIADVGDIMLGSRVPIPVLPPRNGADLLAAAVPALRANDVVIGNLEDTLGDAGAPGKRDCGRCFVFQSPSALAARLVEAGFTMLGMANNHARDFGPAGFAQTEGVLTRLGLAHTGGQGEPPAVVTVRGRRVCLLAFAPNAGINDLRDTAGAVRQIKAARASCAVVVVSFHGGAEGPDRGATPMGREWFLGEDRGDVRAFAHAAVAAGADVVFGQGPHIPRGMELDHGHLIAYSLGNFLTYGGISVAGPLGLAPLVSVRLDDEGRLLDGRVVSFRQSFRAPLAADPTNAAAHWIAARTRADFGGGGLAFEDDGRFAPAAPNRAASTSF